MTYTIDRSTYSAHTITNTETGVTLTQWDRVTVGKSKAEWDVAEIPGLSQGEVVLHRQSNGVVMFRRFHMDRLTVVAPEEEEAPEAPVEAPEEAPAAADVPAVVQAMKAEINGLIAGGVVPADVPDFASLHDYVDANMLAHEVYGSEIPEDETDEQGEARMDRETPIFNEASTAVDAWLKAGRPEEEGVATPCTAPGLACENPNHDHFTNDPDDNKTPEGGRLCNECSAPCHWDEGLQDYRHDSADTPACFLIP